MTASHREIRDSKHMPSRCELGSLPLFRSRRIARSAVRQPRRGGQNVAGGVSPMALNWGPVPSLKGLKIPAQGEALGRVGLLGSSPEGATERLIMPVVLSPLQGSDHAGVQFPGLRPGLYSWRPFRPQEPRILVPLGISPRKASVFPEEPRRGERDRRLGAQDT